MIFQQPKADRVMRDGHPLLPYVVVRSGHAVKRFSTSCDAENWLEERLELEALAARQRGRP